MSNPHSLINDIIRNRRSVYPEHYSTASIDESIIEQLLENANWAPTHGITQPWRFIVFSGEGLKKLADFQSDLYRQVSGDEFDPQKFEKLRTRPLLCSHIIALGMKRQASGKIPEIEEVEAVACAVQNMYLTAAAYGLGCYWGSGGITYYEESKPFFELGKEDKLLGFFYLGHIKKDTEISSGFRKPVGQFVKKVYS